MPGSTEIVAVESAAIAADASETAARNAAIAEVAAETATEAAHDAVTGATVILAEQAVQIADNTATIAKQEAAVITQAAVAAIAENEVKESWQDEAIQRLQTEVSSLSTILQSQSAMLAEIQATLSVTDSRQSAQPDSETPPTVATEIVTETVMASEQTEPPPKSAEESRGRKTAARKRELRFL